jgi:hypothetical protein
MRAFALGGVAALASVAVMAAGQATPPEGDYQIDAETTTTTRSGPMVMKSVQRVDGATGATTLEQTGPDGSVAKQAYPGQGRNHWCVKGPGAPPPPGVVSSCTTQAFAALPAGGSTYQTACSGGQVLSDNFRKLVDGRWERTFQVRQAPVGGVPAPSQTSAAMAPLIAQIEEAIRSGPPAEREAAKQQLAALKASLGGAAVPGNDTVVETRETWTKVSERCG